MKDDKLNCVSFLFLSVHLLLSATQTDLWDKEEEAFADSISFKNSLAFSGEKKKCGSDICLQQPVPFFFFLCVCV